MFTTRTPSDQPVFPSRLRRKSWNAALQQLIEPLQLPLRESDFGVAHNKFSAPRREQHGHVIERRPCSPGCHAGLEPQANLGFSLVFGGFESGGRVHPVRPMDLAEERSNAHHAILQVLSKERNELVERKREVPDCVWHGRCVQTTRCTGG